MSGYYARNGRAITADEWARQRNTDAAIQVDQTVVGDSSISTVWLGMDHSWGEGPPLIFESMIFGGLLDQDCERYSTEAQATDGHAKMIGKVHRAADALTDIASDPEQRAALLAAKEIARRVSEDFGLYDNERTMRLLIEAAEAAEVNG